MWALLAATTLILPGANTSSVSFVLTELGRIKSFNDQDTAVRTMIWVDASGRVIECTVHGFVGSEQVANKVCDLMEGRRLRRPIADGDALAYGLSYVTTTWTEDLRRGSALLNQLNQELPQFDHEIEATSTAPQSPDIGLTLQIDTGGRVVQCQPLKKVEPSATAYCPVAEAIAFEPRKAVTGEPVSYVRSFNIRLKAI